ncbi:MAG: Uncharacterized nucleoside diphosphate sugar transferase SCO3743 [uncultured Nocardioidaceae bacterium]|uniref:Uncharacterized nucleoside diphosphate sugar transferase SCO3743 n=1 Tax=uncultured Nocardioidaceae bacterium TaxID=253824 RepID=A0A6J4N7X1_9ACTN|nr:MAG: Uncharacterized nucleoside diphosphate sugar transferase SCO3743 [uncultured Nocardioidaceae bacterium]
MSQRAQPRVLVVAKVPVHGRVKTRLGRAIGMDQAARLAAASLRDTIRACRDGYSVDRCHLALDGDLAHAVAGAGLDALLDGWTVFPQRGTGLAERLVNAHLDVASRGTGPVLQIGMDTPQVTARLLDDAAQGLEQSDAVLGMALDGGWWILGMRDSTRVIPIRDVAVSTSSTGEETRQVLERDGLVVAATGVLQDVDTVEDADAVAELAPHSDFARTWLWLRPP